MSNRSRDYLDGSWGHTFETKKMDDGRVKVTTLTAAAAGKEWFGDDEQEATQAAKLELHQMALRGEL
jgi:hypothetical protein